MITLSHPEEDLKVQIRIKPFIAVVAQLHLIFWFDNNMKKLFNLLTSATACIEQYGTY